MAVLSPACVPEYVLAGEAQVCARNTVSSATLRQIRRVSPTARVQRIYSNFF